MVAIRAEFLAGQYFDIRLEVHSPVNGSEARKGEPDPNFKFTIAKKDEKPVDVTEYFGIEEPELERWDFSWYEGGFARPKLTEEKCLNLYNYRSFCGRC